MATLVCPYCVTRQEFTVSKLNCDNCETAVPRSFIEAAMVREPVWLITVGSPQVGKTSFIDSLVYNLKAMVKVTEPRVRLKLLDDYTMETMREIHGRSQQGVIQGRTEKDKRFRPLLLDVTNFMGRDHNPVVIYDYAGEIFDDIAAEVGELAPAMREANTVWLFVSISDVRANTSGQSIEWALEYYVRGMQQLEASLDGRELLVIFTKADRLQDELPESILMYLAEDPYAQIGTMSRTETAENQFHLKPYLARMDEISEQLIDYLYENDGYDIIGLAEEHNMALKATINSALGQDTVAPNSTTTNLNRMRVIDPLLYALSSERQGPKRHEVAVILDSTQGGVNAFLATGRHGAAFDALKPRNVDVMTYFMGTSRPQFSAGQRPEGVPLQTSGQPLRTIGSALDALADDVRAIVFTTGEILDLSDYRFSSWDQRLFLITTKELQADWSHVVRYIPDQHTIDALIEEFFRLMPNK